MHMSKSPHTTNIAHPQLVLQFPQVGLHQTNAIKEMPYSMLPVDISQTNIVHIIPVDEPNRLFKLKSRTTNERA